MNISSITSREILDSRGNPTLETTVTLDTGDTGMASVPSGASTGSHESVELRDGGASYDGLSVQKAVANVTGPIAKRLKGQDVREQKAIDQLMIDLDGTVNKSSLGANATLSVSLAVMRARAALLRTPVYALLAQEFETDPVKSIGQLRPMMNIINGGRHADNGMKVQECMIIPAGEDFAERLERGVRVYHALAKVLREKKLSTLLGDEGGFAPTLENDEQAFALIVTAIERCGLQPGTDVTLGIDLAASEFYDAITGRYTIGTQAGGLSSVGLIGLVEEWINKYPLQSIEDPLAEDDWKGWQDITAKLGERVQIVGDDLFVTHPDRLSRGIEAKAANAILIKPNQVGTLTETLETMFRARDASYATIVSHRSGETTDAFIADLAVGSGTPYIKAGAPARGERVAKYNRLAEIERMVRA